MGLSCFSRGGSKSAGSVKAVGAFFFLFLSMEVNRLSWKLSLGLLMSQN